MLEIPRLIRGSHCDDLKTVAVSMRRQEAGGRGQELALEARLVGYGEEGVVGVEGNGQGKGLSDGVENRAGVHVEPQGVW